jgi:DNA-binding NtrC family response regulator/pSer/pThr/pTyr-binding forkhead associated (FHA) protein
LSKADLQTESRIALTRDGPVPEGLSLLVMCEEGVFTYPLPREGEITLGRSEQCEVRVEDPKLSRKHAIVRISGGARQQVSLVDLGSLNGTTLGDRKVAPHQAVQVNVGEMIAIGSTVFVVQSGEAASRKWRLWSHEQFQRRLAEECVRASGRREDEAFALLKIRFRNARDADAIEDVLGDSLRKKDVVAPAGPGVYEILLVETSDVTSDAIASRITSQLQRRGVDVEMHVAVYPRDGVTPDHLEGSEGAPPSRRADSLAADGSLVGGAMRRLQPVIDKIAAGVINVLILGETGVGKEVLARTLHTRSPRSSKPLLCINCAALSESLLESELFGHERGAFTGAVSSKPGLLESAEGGTVFLDEVGEMPLALQAKLLRVLEQREVLRVGSLKPRPIDVRFIAATNRDLETESARGRFRPDLFFRLNGMSVEIPPLRERVDEIEPLARIFLKQACVAAGRTEDVRISMQAMALLKRYRWPGNVRELRNIIERAVLLSNDETITLEHLPSEKMGPVVEIRASRGNASFAQATLPPPGMARRTAPPPLRDLSDEDAEEITMTDVAREMPRIGPVDPRDDERRRIVAALEQCAGNQTQAAKILGISRRTLVTRLGTYALPRPRKKST